MLNLPFGLNKSSDPFKFLTIDISADSAKCLAFYNENGVNKIIGVGKQAMEQNAIRSGSIVEYDQVEQAVEDAVMQATEDLEERSHQTIIGVSGDMCLGHMTTARVVRGTGAPVTQKELAELSKKIIDSSFAEANNKIAQITGNSDIELELITSTPVYTKLDEKLTNQAVGVSAETVELAIYAAFSPTYHVRNLQRLSKKLGLNLIAIGSEMYALISVLKKVKTKHLDCIIMDIGSDTTDIGIVFGGGIVSTRTLSIGGKHFTEMVSQKMGITYKEADNVKKSYALGKLTKSESLIVQSSLQDVLDIWLDGIELTFGEFTGVKTFSPNIYLVGGSSQLPDIMELVSKEPWTHSIPFKNPPEFYKIGLDELTSITDATGRAATPDFVLPASLSGIYDELRGGQNG
ncbi:MAG TPA: pilus assembly protein PilM [Candidatus Saccharimonadales bacterium]|nr:pilus assembly protein PilM [Candidatus Saccharimonadales bacterium]